MTIDAAMTEKQQEYEGGLDLLDSVSDEDVVRWLSEENLSTRKKRSFAGFEITDSIDGEWSDVREVSLVRLLNSQVYPQHVHRASDTLFVITQGEAYLLSGLTRTLIRAGARISIPRGVPHGFELAATDSFVFISVQQPPIRDRVTGEEDLDLVDEDVTLMSLT